MLVNFRAPINFDRGPGLLAKASITATPAGYDDLQSRLVSDESDIIDYIFEHSYFFPSPIFLRDRFNR